MKREYDEKRNILPNIRQVYRIIHPFIFDLSYPIRENLANLSATELFFDPFLLSPTYFLFLLLFSFSRIFNLFRPVPFHPLPLLHFPHIRKREGISLDRVARFFSSRATDIIANEITPSCESYSTLSRCAPRFVHFCEMDIYRWKREREKREELNFIG